MSLKGSENTMSTGPAVMKSPKKTPRGIQTFSRMLLKGSKVPKVSITWGGVSSFRASFLPSISATLDIRSPLLSIKWSPSGPVHLVTFRAMTAGLLPSILEYGERGEEDVDGRGRLADSCHRPSMTTRNNLGKRTVPNIDGNEV